ncbi:MAG: hypothetical protein P8Z70_09930 [Desulfuromonadales bacterium]
MSPPTEAEPTVFVIFGAAGDLTRRKLFPALFNLFIDKQLPGRFHVLGVDVASFDDGKFRRHLRQGMAEFSRRGEAEDEVWADFAKFISYLDGDFTDAQTGEKLKKRLEDIDLKWDAKATRIFYLATPPSLVEPLARHLYKTELCRDCNKSRLVVEKPFGHDLNSARSLDRILTELFEEPQIYRIDHYLGKETVQNILAFRFGNALGDFCEGQGMIQAFIAQNIGCPGIPANKYDGACASASPSLSTLTRSGTRRSTSCGPSVPSDPRRSTASRSADSTERGY